MRFILCNSAFIELLAFFLNVEKFDKLLDTFEFEKVDSFKILEHNSGLRGLQRCGRTSTREKECRKDNEQYRNKPIIKGKEYCSVY